MKRIYSIDILKLYFAYVIAFGHFGICMPGDFVAVKLFFVISGFFLAKKFYSKSYISEGLFTCEKRYNHNQYTIDHIKQLFPHYIFSYIVIMAYTLITYIPDVIKTEGLISAAYLTVRQIYNTIPELLFVQSSGFFDGCINYPVWQINAIILCGYFIYTCMYYCEKLSVDLVFPVVFILFETYWIIGRDPFINIGCLPATLTRGFAMMALGVIIYRFSVCETYKMLCKKTVFYNLFSLFMSACLFIFGRYNGVHMIAICVLILYLYNSESWINRFFNRDIFKFCGNLSYAVYLNHAFVIKIVNSLFASGNNSFVSCIVLFISLTAYSILTLKIVDTLKLHFKK